MRVLSRLSSTSSSFRNSKKGIKGGTTDFKGTLASLPLATMLKTLSAELGTIFDSREKPRTCLGASFNFVSEIAGSEFGGTAIKKGQSSGRRALEAAARSKYCDSEQIRAVRQLFAATMTGSKVAVP